MYIRGDSMARGKNINVFLMDGEANGRIKATISNWIGIAYKIPRAKLAACKERDDLSQSSVYFLFGNIPESPKNAVYIGQAGIRKNGGGILTRLVEHDKNPDKNHWTEAVVFTTSNNSFGPTELSFLEHRFCNMAITAGRYDVRNANDPSPGNITEEKESELDEFADYAELILGVLGYKIFDRATSATAPSVCKKPDILHSSQRRVPTLPDSHLPIGQFVRLAMSALSESGYTFDDKTISAMCTPEWTKTVFHTEKAFMKRYIPGKTDTKGPDGRYVRFWSTPFTFGNTQVLVSKEWYEGRQRTLFIEWYQKL